MNHIHASVDHAPDDPSSQAPDQHDHTPEATLDEWARRFELLGNPTRLRLLSLMHLQPKITVSELAEGAGITQTATSQALRILREQGWIEAQRDGRSIRYVLIDHTVHVILHLTGQTHD